jgi:prepilin-type N-terminal cleavage/methylation domain-containing protein
MKCKDKGFTLVELMIVVSVIGILSSTAVPGYIGYQNKSRRGAMERVAEAAKYELQGWIASARSGVIGPVSKGLLVEVDTDYNGQVENGVDDNNATLAINGVAFTYCNARSVVGGVHGQERSPFAGVSAVPATQPLWWNGAVQSGSISLVDLADASGVINRVTITASDQNTLPINTSVATAD